MYHETSEICFDLFVPENSSHAPAINVKEKRRLIDPALHPSLLLQKRYRPLVGIPTPFLLLMVSKSFAAFPHHTAMTFSSPVFFLNSSSSISISTLIHLSL